MNLTPEEEKIIRFLRKKLNFGKLTLAVTYQNHRIVNVGITERYETITMKDDRERSKI